MSQDLNTEIKIGADASGVEAGVGRAKRSLADLGITANQAGKDAKAGIEGIGKGGDKAAKDVERAASNMKREIERLTASFDGGKKGTREYYESLAKFRSIDGRELKPWLDKLDEAKRKAGEATIANSKLGSSFSGLGAAGGVAARGLAAIGVALSVKEFISLADASTNVASRLGLVTSSATELIAVQSRLFEVSQNSRVSFVDLVGTYTQLARSTKELGVSQSSLLGVVQTISQAVTISGGSAESARAALIQLSQGFSAGALRGEELNSVLEQTPRLAQAIAEGLGVSIGQLRALGAAGELTAEKVLGALEKSAKSVSGEFGKIAVTVEQASTVLENSLGAAIGKLDKAAGITSTLAKAIITAAGAVEIFSDSLVRNKKAVGIFIDAVPTVGLLTKAVRALSGEQDNSAESIKKQIAQLEALNKLGPSIYRRSADDMERYGQAVRARTEEIARLKLELGSLDSSPNTKVGGLLANAGADQYNQFQRQAKAQAQIQSDLDAFRLKSSGVPPSYIKDMAEIIDLNQKGALVGEEYNAALKRQQDILLKKTGVVKTSKAAADQELNSYVGLISSIREKIAADELELEVGGKLTEAQRLRAKFETDILTGRLRLSAVRQDEIRLALDELSTSEAAVIAAQALSKANIDAAASREKYLGSLADGLDKIKDDIAAQKEATKRLGLTKDAIADLDAAKLEMLATDLELQAIKALDRNLDQQTYDALKQQAEAYRELAAAKQEGAAKEVALDLEKANIDAAKKAKEEWEKTADSINQSLTDALLRGFESGKDFAKNLRDTVVNMFKTLVLRPVISAIINPIGGALAGALGFSGSAQAAGVEGGGFGGLAGIANIGSTISQSLNLLNNGISNTIGAAFGRFATSGIGQSLGLGTAPIIGNNPSAFVPSTVTPFGASVGSFLGGAGGFLAGRGLGQAISGGYAVSGSGNAPVNIGAALGAFFGPLGSIVGGAIGGLVNRLFGRKLKDVGVEGTLGGEAGFEGQQFEFYKGGLFRSDKTVYSELDADFERGIANIFKSLRAQTAFFADALGLDAKKIEGFTSAIKISTKGLEPEEIQARFQEAIANANNELAEQLIGSYEDVVTETTRRIQERVGDPDNYDIVFRDVVDKEVTRVYKPSEFAREGEQAIDTLTRLATSLLTVNGIFESLGQAALEASLAGGDIASQLADLFGGLDKFTNAASGYLSAYYTGEEQRALALAQIGRRLGEVGLTTPTSKDELRRQLEAQDLTTEAGRKAYAALLEVAAAFAQVEDSAAAAAQAVQDAYNQRINAAYQVLEAAIGRERDAVQTRVDLARESVDALTDIFDTIADGVKGLRTDALGDVVTGQAAQRFIEQALSAAQSTGYLPDRDQLATAISDARAGLSADSFRSVADQRFEQLRLAGQLAALGDLTETQLTEAQRMLQVGQDQLDALDQQLKYWKEQIDIAQGNLDATISVAEAIDRLTQALIPDVTANTNPTPAGDPFVIGGGNTEPSDNVVRSAGRDASGRYITEQYYGGYGSGFTVVNDEEQARLEALQLIYDNASSTASSIADAFNMLFAAGASLADIGALGSFSYADLIDAARRAGVNSYAVGTNYVPSDQLAFIHKGEAIVPKEYNPAAGGGAGGSTSRMEALLERLTAEVSELKAAANSTANNTATSASVLTSVRNGNSLATAPVPEF